MNGAHHWQGLLVEPKIEIIPCSKYRFMTLTDLANRASTQFLKRFDRPPRWLAAAPGRVNIIGEHTDYNDGFVLPMAIDRFTVIAAAPASENKVRLVSSQTSESSEFSVSETLTSGAPHWGNYVRGVIAGFQARDNTILGFDAFIDSTVPIGGGLSSSASLEVATATLLEGMTGVRLEPVEKALLCQRAEQEFAGVPCGIMDQFTSVMGRADSLLLIDCQKQSCRHVTIAEPEITVLIINSNVKHSLSDGAYAERHAQCEAAVALLDVPSLREARMKDLESRKDQMNPVLFRRAHHVISENDRTVRAADAILACDWRETGRLMYESHNSLRHQFEVSCDELDFLVEAAGEIGEAGGIIGSRMTGGGFGGCTVSLVKAEAVEQIGKTITGQYRSKFGIDASLFVTQPSEGSRIL